MLSRNCVDWSGAWLVSAGGGQSGSPPTSSGMTATFSVPEYAVSLPASIAVCEPPSMYQMPTSPVPGIACAVPLKASQRLYISLFQSPCEMTLDKMCLRQGRSPAVTP
jgi:hypothetical protein